MSADLAREVSDELARIAELPLDEQPAAFADIRELLERALNDVALAETA